MNYNPTTRLTVFLDTPPARQIVGHLASKGRLILFEYDPDFIATGIELSPFTLPLKPGVFTPEDNGFDGLFGLFNDSLPDGWGRLLLDRLVEKHGINRRDLNVLDRLAYVGQHGMGALCYEPDRSLTSSDNEPIQLDKIADEAAIVLAGESEEVFDDLLALNGSSSGARPKIVAQVSKDRSRIIHGPASLQDGFEHWIIKFPSSNDSKDIGATEYAYSLMARAAGVEMPETHLFRTNKGQYFGTKRFDRDGNKRIHTHSLAGLIHADHRTPSLDYDTILKVTMLLTKSRLELEKAFRLACFNVLAHNRDDHSKNFSFLLKNDRQWVLSPAYDLTHSPGPNGEHCTTVLGEGRNPTTEHLHRLGQKHGIATTAAILEEVQQAVADWPSYATQTTVTEMPTDLVVKKGINLVSRRPS
jgi:serine/threonine-protein kinase HipA